MPGSPRRLTALIDKLSPEGVVGFFPDADFIVPPNRDIHFADLNFEMARLVNPALQIDDFSWPPRLPYAAEQFAHNLRQSLPEWARVLVVHPDTDQSKCWSAESFVRLLDEFLDRRPDFLAWIVGMPYGALDVGRHAARVVSYVGLPLAETMALVGQADLFIGVDSCMLHAADLYRVPGVGLFGPTSVAEWGFRFGPHRHVQRVGSLALVTVEEVMEVLDDLVEAGRSAHCGRVPGAWRAGKAVSLCHRRVARYHA